MFIRFSVLLLFSLLTTIQGAFAQGGNSPYSIIGFGQLASKGSIRNISMGGLGVSTGSGLYSNVANPALLYYNKFTLFEASYFMEQKTLESDNIVQKDAGGGMNYLTFAFPINKRWTIGAGLRPISTVNYDISSFDKLVQFGSREDPDELINTDTFVDYTYLGEGGITQVYFSNGVNIYKGLSVGLEIGYNFGSITKHSNARIYGGTSYIIDLLERSSYSQITFRPGVHYRMKLNEDNVINMGATYTPASDYGIKYFRAIERFRVFNQQEITIASDSLSFDEGLKEQFPSGYTVGISYEKIGKYSIGIEYNEHNWSEYSDFRGNRPLKDAYRISVGGEFTPDFSSVTEYWKRITWRAGFKYEQLPWIVQDIRLEDYSFNMGFTLPMPKGFSSVSFAGSYGWVNSKNDEQLIKEDYFRFNIGLTVNDQWFIRRRIN